MEFEKETLYYARRKHGGLNRIGFSKSGYKRNEQVIVKIKMTKEEWNEYGINDTNANFERVKENGSN